MYKRMKAIGELIQLHSPEIICFQVFFFFLVRSNLIDFRTFAKHESLFCRRLLRTYMKPFVNPAGGRLIVVLFQMGWQIQDHIFACW